MKYATGVEQSGTRSPGVQEDVNAKEEHLGRDLAPTEVSSKVLNWLLKEQNFSPGEGGLFRSGKKDTSMWKKWLKLSDSFS